MKPPAKTRIVQLATALALAGACVVPSAAQRKSSAGPRAVGVLVLPRDAGKDAKQAKDEGRPRTYLIPLTLWYQNRFFDASLYGARPEPMALDGGIVYEASKGGESAGLFTLEGAGQIEKRWFGVGDFRSAADIEAERARKAKEKPMGPPTDEVKGDGPPRLLRKDSAGSRDSGSRPKSDDGPPVLKKPDAAPTSNAPEPGPKAPDTPPPAAKPAPARTDDRVPDDPDRPRLRRNPGGVTQSVGGPVSSLGPMAHSNVEGLAQLKNPPDVLVAVSDAKSQQSRPYAFQWNAEEQARLTRSTLIKANGAIADYLAKTYHVTPAAPTTPVKPAAKSARSAARAARMPAAPPEPEPLENLQVRAFDLQYDNYPEVVLSGQRTVKVPNPSAPDAQDDRVVFVTVVVKVDLQTADQRDVYRTLLAHVTDDRHLDEFPMLRLVDAIDADGNGSGDLLFSAIDSVSSAPYPQSWGFRLYRLGPDKLEKIYDTAGKLE